MTHFTMPLNATFDGDKKSSISIMAVENGHHVPAMTIIAANGRFPINDIKRFAEVLTDAMNGHEPRHDLEALGCSIHFAQHENGKPLNGFKLRFRTPDSGVTAEDGMGIYIPDGLSDNLRSVVRQVFVKQIPGVIERITKGPMPPMSLFGPEPSPAH